jgi:hypothetical protein
LAEGEELETNILQLSLRGSWAGSRLLIRAVRNSSLAQGGNFARPFIIENRTGAGGNIGIETVIRAAPDGYTVRA